MSTTFNFDSNLPEDDKFGGKVFEVLKVLKCDSNSSNIILNTKNNRTLCGNNYKKVHNGEVSIRLVVSGKGREQKKHDL